MQNSRTDFVDLLPLDEKTLPYTGSWRQLCRNKSRAADSPALRFGGRLSGFRSGVHISCNASGWAVISTYTEPDARCETGWIARSSLYVSTRIGPEAYYLAHVHNTTGQLLGGNAGDDDE